MPRASIVIPTYNRYSLVKERALKSALAQDYGDYEVIIVDHGSTDTTSLLEKEYPQVRYIKIAQNSGIVSTARNAGAREANGKYIVFVDDDNELMPNFLSETIPLLEKSEDMSAVSVGRVVKHTGYEDYAPSYPSDHRGHEKFISLDWGWLIRREVFDKIQYDEKMFFHEDADFGLRFTEKFAYLSHNKPLGVAYAHEEGASHSAPTPVMINAMDYFIEKNWRFYKNQPNELRYLYRLMGRRCYMGGWKMKGINFFWKSFCALKSWKTFKHLFFILLGWKVYNWYMTREEKIGVQKHDLL